jgi:hypothetical protein
MADKWSRRAAVGLWFAAMMWLAWAGHIGPNVAAAPPAPDEKQVTAQAGSYVLLAWNDLGMHCYNPSFQNLAVLPPYNTVWAQLLQVGDPPVVITQNVRIDYSFVDNSYSAGKTDFWPKGASLFGSPPPNVGLSGRGLTGTMTVKADHFVAEGIPLTEYNDSAPTTRHPFQLATIVAYDQATNTELARTTTVAPVSSEMRCDNCHGNGKDPGGSQGTDLNILAVHDDEEGTNLRSASKPVLCASCHSDNALGLPGTPGHESLARAMHHKHAGEGLPSTLAGCYNCHPGPTTRCLRDVMSVRQGKICTDCHGGWSTIYQNPNPWLQEPTCAQAGCHSPQRFSQDQALYRMSRGHGGVYCEGCHDSTHAIAPSREPNDGIKFMAWQGHNGPLYVCTVCHVTRPATGMGGPHMLVFTPTQRIGLPIVDELQP